MFNDNESNIKNIALYTRVSTEEQAERGLSLSGQMKTLRSHCENKGWTVTGEYVDDGYTGRNTRRPQYTMMLQDIQKWDGILVLKMDRIHRNSKNFMNMMDQLRKFGKEFISFNENLDTSTAMGRFVMDIIQRIAQLESEQIGERVAFAMVEKAKDPSKGFMGHKLPFGYKLNNHKIKEMPEYLEIVKKCFELYQNGGTFRNLGKRFNKSNTTIRYYLNNIFYAGYERYCHYFRKIKQPNFRPVITKEIWNQTQEKMRRNCRTQNYDPILIPDDEPEFFILNNEEVNTIPIINRAKHNYLT